MAAIISCPVLLLQLDKVYISPLRLTNRVIFLLLILVVVQLNGTQVTRCHTKLTKYHVISIFADVQE